MPFCCISLTSRQIPNKIGNTKMSSKIGHEQRPKALFKKLNWTDRLNREPEPKLV